jgi:hypothetical protein
MYYVRQEARQVALSFAARQSGRAFGRALAFRSAGLAGFQRSGIITGDRFRVRECYLPPVLSYLSPELLYVVHASPPVSVTFGRDHCSVSYSPPGSRPD